LVFKSFALLVLSQVIELFNSADVLDICLFIDITAVLHILARINYLRSNLDSFVNWWLFISLPKKSLAMEKLSMSF